MKNLLSILSLSLLLLFVSSCSDFLEEDNKGGINNEDFYATKGGYETLVTASYEALRSLYGPIPVQDLYGTDVYMERKEPGDNLPFYRYEQLFSTNGYLEDWYNSVYEAIQKTNAAIFFNDLPSGLTDAERNSYLGEVRFLRAFYHFLLIEQFGGIVINDEYTASPRTEIPRSSLADSYTFVIGELEAALAAVPATSDPGRINKDVVNHYLAKVHVTRGWDLESSADFTTAISYADAVIANRGPISIPYAELWDEEGENNEEFLFTVQYSLSSVKDLVSGGNRQSSLYQSYGGSAGNEQKRRSEDLAPANWVHRDFQQNDDRYLNIFSEVTYHPYFSMYTDNPGLVRYYTPIIWDPNKTEITAADSAQWIAELGGEENIEDEWRLSPVWKHQYDMYNAISWDFTGGGVQPIVTKFDSPENGDNCTLDYAASVRDVVLARLAETYFIEAEANIGLNQFTAARDLVQEVLDRPGNKIDPLGADLTNALDGAATQTDALEGLMIESGKEMFGEYNGRWALLRRTNMLKYMLENYNADFDRYNITFDEDWALRPIPQSAIILNDGLSDADQNPGY